MAGGALACAATVLALAVPASANAATISIDDPSVTEGDIGTASAVYTVSLSEPTAEQVSVDFATSDGTAVALLDYTAHSETVTFAPGETSKQVTVAVHGDLFDEADEAFHGDLTNASAATIADSQGTATIVDDDGAPGISIGDASEAEGHSGQKQLAFDVSLSNPSAAPITVDYATTDGSATTADGDYDSKSGTVTFAAGDTSETVTVNVNGDGRDEADETFNVNLSNASSNSSIADGQGVGTITNDDSDPSISIDDVSSTEGDGGEKDFQFTLSLSNPSDQTTSVNYTTADGSATEADSDYDPASGTVVFAPGDVSETLAVTVNGDSADEAHETFSVDLAGSSPNSTIADSRGVGTIQNDDAAPTAAACPPAADGQEGSVGALGDFRLAQTFTSHTSSVVESVHVRIDKRAGAGGDWELSVNSTDGSGAPSDDVLGSVSVSDAAVAPGVSTIGGTFDKPVALTAGEAYALVLTRPGADEVRARIRVGEVCGGEIFRSLDQTGPFAAISSFPSIPPGLDIVFAVCGSTGPCFPPPEPASAPGPPAEPAPDIELKPGLAVTLEAAKRKVRQGSRVSLSGRVEAGGDPACGPGQMVSLQRRRVGGAAFKTIAQVQADAQGGFSVRARAKKTAEYRAEVSGTATCGGGVSNTQTVKVRDRR